MRELLERYWKCETSQDEEQKLREWFAGNGVPEDLKKYRDVFQALDDFKELKAPASISRKAQSYLPAIQLYPSLKIAASVLIAVSIGIGIYTHYQQEEFLKGVFSETYSDPQDAIKETQAVLDKISSSLLKAKDCIEELQEDSVVINEPEELIIEEE
ncbi:hypothetical protein FACS1894174_07100 [Bacteroidia bacterium]|nr:hypothetical protein FACS1894155_08770 [Bacteroidia bacterium]GHV22462.1 hypothetical protein FACS1894174_07100 [Bacteroidia bacterium]